MRDPRPRSAVIYGLWDALRAIQVPNMLRGAPDGPSPVRAYIRDRTPHPRRASDPRITPRRKFREAIGRYGIAPEDWARMWERQAGRCPLCTRPMRQDGPPQRHGGSMPRSDVAVVDHAHDTGKVRGLICNDRNRTALAWADRVGPVGLARLATYLEVGT